MKKRRAQKTFACNNNNNNNACIPELRAAPPAPGLNLPPLVVIGAAATSGPPILYLARALGDGVGAVGFFWSRREKHGVTEPGCGPTYTVNS